MPPAKVREKKVRQVLEIPLKQIRMFKRQPRRRFNQERIRRLAESIKARGQITPIHVKRLTTEEENKSGFRYEAVDGQRRYMAHELIQAERPDSIVTIDAIEVIAKTFLEQYTKSVMANFHHEEHTLQERVEAIGVLRNEGCTAKEISEMFGFHPAYIAQHAQLLQLDKMVMDRTDPDVPDEKRLQFATALVMASLLKDQKHQLEVLESVCGQVPIQRARHIIEEFAAAHGLPPPTRRTDVQWKSLRTFAERAGNMAELFVQKGSAFLDEATAPYNSKPLIELAQAIQKCRSNLLVLEEGLRRRAKQKDLNPIVSLPSSPPPLQIVPPIKPAEQPAPPKLTISSPEKNNGHKAPEPKAKAPIVPQLTPGQIADRAKSEAAQRALRKPLPILPATLPNRPQRLTKRELAQQQDLNKAMGKPTVRTSIGSVWGNKGDPTD